MKDELTKKNMNDLPEKYREALYQKRIKFPALCEKEDFLDLYDSVLVDNVIYLKEGYELPEEYIGSLFKASIMANAVIMKDYIIKNRYGYDGKMVKEETLSEIRNRLNDNKF